MIYGPNDGTSDALTVEEAASGIERLLPLDDEETEAHGPTTDEAPDDAAHESDPAESDESEQSDDDGQSEGDEEQDEQEAGNQTFRVKVDGEEVEVTLDELLRGYSRQQDYTRKTQALAEQRKEFASEAAAVRAEREYYAQNLALLEQALASLNAEPDWDQLQQENPAAFAVLWAQHQRQQAQLAAVRAERARVEQMMLVEHQHQFREYVEAEKAKLIEAIPAWQNAEVARKEAQELYAYAMEAGGYTKEELDQVYDHRAFLLLRKAMLYDKQQQAKQTVGKQRVEKVRVAAPGNPAAQRRPSRAQAARARLAKSGRVSDAAELFLDLIDD